MENIESLASRTDMNPKKPFNFSWVIDNQLAGMGYPRKDSNLLYLYNEGISNIISLGSGESPAEKYREFNTLALNVREFSPPTLEQIKTCVDFIEKCIAENKAVAVHCEHGLGRTGTIIASYLAKKHCIDGDEAIQMLREMRPWSVETSEQEEIVRTFAKGVVV